MPAIPLPFRPAQRLDPLRAALVEASTGPTAVSPKSFKNMGSLQIIMNPNSDKNLPQPLYWSVNNDDPKATVLQFAALLDMKAPHTQIGPYFNLPANKPITAREFKKMKTTITIHPLPKDPAMYPQDAIDCSQRAVELLENLSKVTEAKRSEALAISKGNLTLWNNASGDNTTSALKLQTEPLFLPSGDEQGAKTAREMPDVDLRYRNLFKTKPDLAGYIVASPTIKNHDGSIIAPADYLAKLGDKHLQPICIQVIPRVWEIQPTKDGKKPAKRVYQLIIKSIQLLPIKKTLPLPSRIATSSTPQSPLKRKKDESDELEVLRRNKRKS